VGVPGSNTAIGTEQVFVQFFCSSFLSIPRSFVMSIASVQEFLGKVSDDQSLQEELAIAMGSENDREAVTALAQSKGYDFTSDELAQEIENRQAEAQERQAAGELSDEELEAVAGGEFVVSTGIAASIILAGGLASVGVGIGVSKIKW
jgi:predicted ribosomally synthesized peptide with nif11-like leader